MLRRGERSEVPKADIVPVVWNDGKGHQPV